MEKTFNRMNFNNGKLKLDEIIGKTWGKTKQVNFLILLLLLLQKKSNNSFHFYHERLYNLFFKNIVLTYQKLGKIKRI